MRMNIKSQIPLFFNWAEHKISKELQQIATILDRHPEFVESVHCDLTSNKKTTGDKGMSSDQILRAAIIKNIRGLSYEQLAFNLSDSFSTRSFLMMDLGESYSSSCLQENISKISESTWENISEALVFDATKTGFENGKQVRVDSTVTDVNIGYPTDSKLLYDCIRVIDREFKNAREVAEKIHWRLTSCAQAKEAKGLRYQINNAKNDEERLPIYKKLLKIAKKIKRDLPSIIAKIEKVLNKKESTVLKRSFEQLSNVNFFLEKIIYQTEQRVLNGIIIPSPKKVVSIFEPHTDIIVKDRRETQFGHKIFITSGVSNMVLHCDIPKGNANDADMFLGTIEAIKNSFGKYPTKVSADGGFASEENIFVAQLLGVKDVCFPKRCNMEIEDMVKSEWVYEKLLNWRAGIEAVISFLKRCFGLSKANWSGFDGFKRYVRCGIASYNLLLLARNEMLAN